MNRRTLIVGAGLSLSTPMVGSCSTSAAAFTFALIMKAEISGTYLQAESFFADRAYVPFLEKQFDPEDFWRISTKGGSPIIQHPTAGVLCALMNNAASPYSNKYGWRDVASIPLYIDNPRPLVVDHLWRPKWGLQSGPKAFLRMRHDTARNMRVPASMSPQLAWIRDPNDLLSCLISDENRIESDSGGAIKNVSFYLSGSEHALTSKLDCTGDWTRQLHTEGDGVGRYLISKGHLIYSNWQP